MMEAWFGDIFILLAKGQGKEEQGKILCSQAIFLPGIYSPEPDVWWQKQQQPLTIQRQSFTFSSVSILGAH